MSSDGPRLVEQDVWLISEEDVRAAETEDEGGGGKLDKMTHLWRYEGVWDGGRWPLC